ncbi:MAG: preprotein translocase subunit SecY [Clostridia bacterium]|nr:preprotein translocase subunit SecY [Clostridia bacterium]
MIQTMVQAWKIPEMRKKILYTLFMLVIFRLGSNIPVPCIDRSQLAAMFNANESGLFGLFDLFSGGSFSNFTIFALSITPYITSSIILQLLTVAIPKLEELARQGQEGQRKIAQWTRYITVVLALIQAVGYTFGLFRNVLSDNSVFAKLVIVCTLVAGTAFLMWLGERINENGIGNGISLIIFAGIVSRIPTSISRTVKNISAGTVSIVSVILFCIFAVLIVVGIILVQEGTRKVPVQYAKRVVGRKMYGGQSSHIPLKVNQAGVIPVIFAISLLQLPATIAYMVPNSGFASFVSKYLTSSGYPGVWIYFVLNIMLIIFFTYFYGSITVNPFEIAENMKANGGFIPGIRPGKPTVEYITKVITRLTFASAIFLSIVASLPTLLQHWTNLSIGFGGTSLIIAVGVALDTMKSMETQMVMRNYSGFLK